MSFQMYFEQVEAVARVLDEWVRTFEYPEDFEVGVTPDEDVFTAIWQAVELLSRAYTVLLPMVQFEASKVALSLPDVMERKGTIYGPDGQAL